MRLIILIDLEIIKFYWVKFDPILSMNAGLEKIDIHERVKLSWNLVAKIRHLVYL